MKFSQNDEEIYILNHFKDKSDGRFLDIGAYTGVELSNTRALALKGWSGVLAEASPQCFAQLQKNYLGYKNIQLVCAAISARQHTMKFFDSGGAVATAKNAHYEAWKDHQKDFQEIIISTLNVVDLLYTVGNKFDFISIDTEGMDHEILMQLSQYHFCEASMICVEFGKDMIPISEILRASGYKPVYQNAENLLVIKS